MKSTNKNKGKAAPEVKNELGPPMGQMPDIVLAQVVGSIVFH